MTAKLGMLRALVQGVVCSVSLAALVVSFLPGTVLVAETAASTMPCEVPAEFENRFVVVNGDVEVTIASERAEYKAGETITIFILYRNIGTETLRIERPSTPMHGFSVLPEDCKSAHQPECDAMLRFQIPFIVFPAFDLMVLASGECKSWSYPWNGRDRNGAQLLGRFTVLGGIWERPPVMFLNDYSVPEGGAPLGIEIGEVGVDQATWGKVRALFR
jgi:hypothetical protein